MTEGHEEARAIGTSARRSRELEEREQPLLAAAIALMDRDDWEAVTVEDIARRAEYAKGTVYRHFASKDDLHARLVADWTAGTAAALEALDADRPFEAVLRDLVAVCWKRLTADRVHARLFQHVQRADFLARLTPASRAALTAADARILGLVAALDRLGHRRGRDPARPARAAPLRRHRPPHRRPPPPPALGPPRRHPGRHPRPRAHHRRRHPRPAARRLTLFPLGRRGNPGLGSSRIANRPWAR